jgi:hypothetical protein
MNHRFVFVTLFSLVTLATSPAQAIFKAYVSSSGSDANICVVSSPCQSLTRGLAVADDGGEVSCLDGYGFFSGSNVAISKSVTIDCGAAGGFFPNMTITIDSPGIVVRLRNLKMSGSLGLNTSSAIAFTDGAALILENCLIQHYVGIAITFRPSAPGSQLLSKDSVSSNNGTAPSSGGGLQVAPQSGGSAGVVLDHATFNFNVTAIVLNSGSGSIGGTMRDSLVASNRSNGILTQAGSFISLLIDRSLLSNNVGSAIQSSGASSFVRIGSSTISANDTGVSVASGGTVQSFKDNKIFGNSTDGTPLTAVPGYSGTGQ